MESRRRCQGACSAQSSSINCTKRPEDPLPFARPSIARQCGQRPGLLHVIRDRVHSSNTSNILKFIPLGVCFAASPGSKREETLCRWPLLSRVFGPPSRNQSADPVSSKLSRHKNGKRHTVDMVSEPNQGCSNKSRETRLAIRLPHRRWNLRLVAKDSPLDVVRACCCPQEGWAIKVTTV